jgi:hypothetical protein
MARRSSIAQALLIAALARSNPNAARKGRNRPLQKLATNTELSQSPTSTTKSANSGHCRTKKETCVSQLTSVSLDQCNYPHERHSRGRPRPKARRVGGDLDNCATGRCGDTRVAAMIFGAAYRCPAGMCDFPTSSSRAVEIAAILWHSKP